jgi:predicted nucleotidyltransferase
VTRDPDEGVGADGYLTTGVALDRIPPAYVAVVADCVVEITRALGATLHGLYLYGSVATGRARRPASDLDLLVVTLSAVDVTALEVDLSARHRDMVREVGVSRGTLAEVWADDAEGVGGRCFLKHYCLPLAGVDLRAQLPACRPSREVADGFNGDLSAACRAWRSTVDTPGTAQNAARRLLRAAATLESVEHGGWSTDRVTGAELVTRHHPEWTVTVRRALSWIDRPAHVDPDHVRDLLAFGDWLATRPRPVSPLPLRPD